MNKNISTALRAVAALGLVGMMVNPIREGVHRTACDDGELIPKSFDPWRSTSQTDTNDWSYIYFDNFSHFEVDLGKSFLLIAQNPPTYTIEHIQNLPDNTDLKPSIHPGQRYAELDIADNVYANTPSSDVADQHLRFCKKTPEGPYDSKGPDYENSVWWKR